MPVLWAIRCLCDAHSLLRGRDCFCSLSFFLELDNLLAELIPASVLRVRGLHEPTEQEQFRSDLTYSTDQKRFTHRGRSARAIAKTRDSAHANGPLS